MYPILPSSLVFRLRNLEKMILATDVHYSDSTAVAAGVLFQNWSDAEPQEEYVCKIPSVESYESGSFYKRELPCILTLLQKYKLTVDCIVIDGYVYLDNHSRPGLGKYLFDALGGTVTVVGVAKSSFPGISTESEIVRGKSQNPLYVTSTGNIDAAKSDILGMHGEFRLPTLLKRVDSLCRTGMS